MGIAYKDDISGNDLAKEDCFWMEFTKFYKSKEGGDRMQKSAKFYVGIPSITKILGDRGLGWTIMAKDTNGKYTVDVTNSDSPLQ